MRPDTRRAAREQAYEAQGLARTARKFQPTANEVDLSRALERLAEAFIISTCIGDDPCGVCEECKAQAALAAADLEAHEVVA